jgi:hypothetical protein
MSALWLDVVLNVKIVHVIEPPTETAGRDDDVNMMRKFLFGARCSELAFVARHLGLNFWNSEGGLNYMRLVGKINADFDERLMCRRVRALATNFVELKR